MSRDLRCQESFGIDYATALRVGPYQRSLYGVRGQTYGIEGLRQKELATRWCLPVSH